MMTRFSTLAALLALAGLSCFARAAADPVNLETKWQEKTVSITTTGVTALTFDVAGFGAVGGPILGQTATFNGVDGSTYGATSVVTSTWTNAMPFDYWFYAQGATGTLKIAQTIKMPVPNGLGIRNQNGIIFSSSTYNTPYPAANLFTVPVISTSAAITEPSGIWITHQFTAQTTNPVFLLTNLTAAATYTLTVDYGVPRAQ